VTALSIRERRYRLVSVVGGLVLLALSFAAARWQPIAAPAFAAAGVGFVAAGGRAVGLVIGCVGAGLVPLEGPLRVALGVGAVAIYDRTSRRDDATDHITEQAYVDRLTGLRTYAYFTEALAREIGRVRRYGGSCSLVLLDLDRFKEFNDRYGHAAGNALLARVGSTITALVRDSDVACRFGGEELVVLVPGSARQAVGLAERIREAVGEIVVPIGQGRRPVGTTVSAGVAECPANGRTAEALFAAADAALYRAKHEGRNRVVVDGEVAARRVRAAS